MFTAATRPSPPIRPLRRYLTHWAPIWARFIRAGASIGLITANYLLLHRGR
jgi:hypothetical protein